MEGDNPKAQMERLYIMLKTWHSVSIQANEA